MSDLNTSGGLPRVNVGKVADSYANVRAQESRDLSDKLGLTADIEREFAQGASVGEVAAALELKLGAIEEGDRSAFLVGVRGTLGIPANFGLAGETEFAHWKAEREARMREAEPSLTEQRETAASQQPVVDAQVGPVAAVQSIDTHQEPTGQPAQAMDTQAQADADHVNAIIAGIDPELIDGGDQVAEALGITPEQESPGVKDSRSEDEEGDRVKSPADAERDRADSARRTGKKARAILSKSGYEIPKAVQAQYVAREGAFVDRKTESIAFEDSGRKLSTKAEDRKTIESMIAVADAKNWGTLYVKGTEEFRRQAWIAAQVAGLEVIGYEPNPQDKAAVEARREEMRIGAGDRSNAQERENSVAPNDEKDKGTRGQEADVEKPARSRLPEKQQLAVDTLGAMLSQRGLQPGEVAKAVDAATAKFVEDRVHIGEVVEHGPAPYEHNPENSRSYFVTLATANGQETIWGVDLQRSAEDGKFAEGKEVMLAYQGRTEVVVPTRERDADGKLTGQMVDTLTHRNTWDVISLDQLQEIGAGKSATRERDAETQQPAQQAQQAPASAPEIMSQAELEELRIEMAEWRRTQDLEQARDVIERHSTPQKRHDAARELLSSLGRDPNEFFDESGKPRDERVTSAPTPLGPNAEMNQGRQESAKEAAMLMVLEHEMTNAGIPEGQRQEMRDELNATLAHAHQNGIELEIPEPVVMDGGLSPEQDTQPGVNHHRQQEQSIDVDR